MPWGYGAGLLYPHSHWVPIPIHSFLLMAIAALPEMGIQNDFKIFLYSIQEKYLELARAKNWVPRPHYT